MCNLDTVFILNGNGEHLQVHAVEQAIGNEVIALCEICIFVYILQQFNDFFHLETSMYTKRVPMVVIVPYELSKGKKLTVRNTFNQPEIHAANVPMPPAHHHLPVQGANQ